MFYTLLFIHVLLCVILIGLVLMQQGKGADMGAAFGGSSSSLFGAGGATDFVTKLTTSLAIAFMVTSILLVRAYSGFSHMADGEADALSGSVIADEAGLQGSVVATEEQAGSEEAKTDAAGSTDAAQSADTAATDAKAATDNQTAAGTAKEPEAAQEASK